MSYHMGSIWYELWGGCSYGFSGVTTFFVSWNRLLVWCCKFFVGRCRVFTCHMRNTLLSASFRGGCRCSRIFWGQRRVLVFSIAVVAPHEHSTHKHPNLWGVERRRFKGCISRYSTGWGRESSSLYLLRFSCSSPTHLWKLFMSSWSGRALLCSRFFGVDGGGEDLETHERFWSFMWASCCVLVAFCGCCFLETTPSYCQCCVWGGYVLGEEVRGGFYADGFAWSGEGWGTSWGMGAFCVPAVGGWLIGTLTRRLRLTLRRDYFGIVRRCTGRRRLLRVRDVAQIESEVCADAKLIEATQTNTPYW